MRSKKQFECVVLAIGILSLSLFLLLLWEHPIQNIPAKDRLGAGVHSSWSREMGRGKEKRSKEMHAVDDMSKKCMRTHTQFVAWTVAGMQAIYASQHMFLSTNALKWAETQDTLQTGGKPSLQNIVCILFGHRTTSNTHKSFSIFFPFSGLFA